MTINPQRNPATLYPQVLGREIGDRITVKRRPQGVGSAIGQDCVIEGITHRIDVPNGVWETTWNLSPVNTLPLWILGVAGSSELGETTRLGF